MINDGTDKYIDKISDCPSLYKIENNALVFLGEYYQCDWKNNHRKYRINIITIFPHPTS